MGWVVNATLRPLYPREGTGTHCIGGWVGLRAGLENLDLTGFDPRIAQPVASRYTDYAFSALKPNRPPLQGVPGLS